MTVRVVLSHDKHWNDVGALAASTLEPWCKRHGYHLHHELFWDSDLQGRPQGWGGIGMLLRLVCNCPEEWLFYTGADIVLTNPTKRLEDIVAKYGVADILAAHDSRTGVTSSGSLLLRNNEWVRGFLQRWWDGGPHSPNYPRLWDNGVLLDLVKEPDIQEHLILVPHKELLSLPGWWRPDDLLMHVAGHVSHDDKLAQMRKYIELSSSAAGGYRE